MPKLAKFNEVFNALKRRIISHNLSIQEIAENSTVSEELIELLFDDKNNVINDISRLIEFLNVNVSYSERAFKVYIITDSGKQLKVTRIIKPRCSIYFDKPTQEFYRFEVKHKRHNKISRPLKQLIMSEMKEFTEDYIRKLQ
jgi:transcriptional regulator with XRE-family HTH domain